MIFIIYTSKVIKSERHQSAMVHDQSRLAPVENHFNRLIILTTGCLNYHLSTPPAWLDALLQKRALLHSHHQDLLHCSFWVLCSYEEKSSSFGTKTFWVWNILLVAGLDYSSASVCLFKLHSRSYVEFRIRGVGFFSSLFGFIEQLHVIVRNISILICVIEDLNFSFIYI